jgi:hypothetical protein
LEKLDLPIAKIREPRPNSKILCGNLLILREIFLYYILWEIENQAAFPKFLNFGKAKLEPRSKEFGI